MLCYVVLCYESSRNACVIPIGVYIDGQLTNDLDLFINQWLTEYNSLYNTCHNSSDKLISNTVLYNLNLSSSRDGNCMLNEPLNY